ncbi:hypothetical protein ABZP36_010845 [Zizania latifolia]
MVNLETDCPGTQSEAAGKADAYAGCPNQQICAIAPKGPDPEGLSGVAHHLPDGNKSVVGDGGGGEERKAVVQPTTVIAAGAAPVDGGLDDRHLLYTAQRTQASSHSVSTLARVHLYENLLSGCEMVESQFMIIPNMLKNAPMFKRLEARIWGLSRKDYEKKKELAANEIIKRLENKLFPGLQDTIVLRQDLSGTEPVFKLPSSPTSPIIDPHLSPDGSMFAYVQNDELHTEKFRN